MTKPTDYSLITKFENAMVDLIERYVDEGLTNADIRCVLDARRDDDHECRDKPQPDPNIIYPGKDDTNVFPEEK